MAAEITMPQLSDTMAEGTVVKWHKKEGDKVKSGEEIADVETDKAVMPMESFESGTLAVIVAKEGDKVKVGGILGVIATGSEKVEDLKKQYASGGKGSAGAAAPAAPAKPQAAPAEKSKANIEARTQTQTSVAPAKTNYQFDIVVIGGGPAGYAAAIRAG